VTPSMDAPGGPASRRRHADPALESDGENRATEPAGAISAGQVEASAPRIVADLAFVAQLLRARTKKLGALSPKPARTRSRRFAPVRVSSVGSRSAGNAPSPSRLRIHQTFYYSAGFEPCFVGATRGFEMAVKRVLAERAQKVTASF